MKVNGKDLATGLIFLALGAAYGSITLRTLPLGQALNMGPGYFPMVLCVFLVLVGGFIAVRSFAIEQGTPFGAIPWRGVILLSLSTILFATFLQQLGMLPGIFLTTLVASLASSRVSPVEALLTSAGVALFCTAIFGYGLELPVPLFGSWFHGMGGA